MKQASTRSTSHETLSETPQVQKALYRLQQSKLRAATTSLGDYLLLRSHLPTTAELLLALSERAREHVLRLGAHSTPRLPGISLPPDERRLLSDADSHAPVVAKRILRQRIQERVEIVTALQALLPQVRGEALRSLLQRIIAEDEEQLAALRAAEHRLSNS